MICNKLLNCELHISLMSYLIDSRSITMYSYSTCDRYHVSLGTSGLDLQVTSWRSGDTTIAAQLALWNVVNHLKTNYYNRYIHCSSAGLPRSQHGGRNCPYSGTSRDLFIGPSWEQRQFWVARLAYSALQRCLSRWPGQCRASGRFGEIHNAVQGVQGWGAVSRPAWAAYPVLRWCLQPKLGEQRYQGYVSQFQDFNARVNEWILTVDRCTHGFRPECCWHRC